MAILSFGWRFELLHKYHQLGISQQRADWFVRWTYVVAEAGFVNMSFAGALEYEKSFLGSFYQPVSGAPSQRLDSQSPVARPFHASLIFPARPGIQALLLRHVFVLFGNSNRGERATE